MCTTSSNVMKPKALCAYSFYSCWARFGDEKERRYCEKEAKFLLTLGEAGDIGHSIKQRVFFRRGSAVVCKSNNRALRCFFFFFFLCFGARTRYQYKSRYVFTTRRIEFRTGFPVQSVISSANVNPCNKPYTLIYDMTGVNKLIGIAIQCISVNDNYVAAHRLRPPQVISKPPRDKEISEMIIDRAARCSPLQHRQFPRPGFPPSPLRQILHSKLSSQKKKKKKKSTPTILGPLIVCIELFRCVCACVCLYEDRHMRTPRSGRKAGPGRATINMTAACLNECMNTCRREYQVDDGCRGSSLFFYVCLCISWYDNFIFQLMCFGRRVVCTAHQWQWAQQQIMAPIVDCVIFFFFFFFFLKKKQNLVGLANNSLRLLDCLDKKLSVAYGQRPADVLKNVDWAKRGLNFSCMSLISSGEEWDVLMAISFWPSSVFHAGDSYKLLGLVFFYFRHRHRGIGIGRQGGEEEEDGEGGLQSECDQMPPHLLIIICPPTTCFFLSFSSSFSFFSIVVISPPHSPSNSSFTPCGSFDNKQTIHFRKPSSPLDDHNTFLLSCSSLSAIEESDCGEEDIQTSLYITFLRSSFPLQIRLFLGSQSLKESAPFHRVLLIPTTTPPPTIKIKTINHLVSLQAFSLFQVTPPSSNKSYKHRRVNLCSTWLLAGVSKQRVLCYLRFSLPPPPPPPPPQGVLTLAPIDIMKNKNKNLERRHLPLSHFLPSSTSTTNRIFLLPSSPSITSSSLTNTPSRILHSACTNLIHLPLPVNNLVTFP
ncbi:hypothetical protein VP01_1481g3 [Puccinia sorghi]|uniref:Uncharacterized protein n=1 Tax=Puccinia sorghi TaxID=27349 RepID=A0A0L6VK49_9BASI|nr:hypothetical protein VP01_1481g3 [Puccinia sorghi]